MSRLFGGHGFVSAASIGGEPDGVYCALCGSSVGMFGQVHIASMRAICGHCVRADGGNTERLASRLAARDEHERVAQELFTAESGA